MNLHEIPRELKRPIIDPEWEKAARSFQMEYNNRHPIVFTVRNGVVISMGYRNGNFWNPDTGKHRLQRTGLSLPSFVADWASRHYTEPLNWGLVEIIDESYHEVGEWV